MSTKSTENTNFPFKCYDFCINNDVQLPQDPSNIRVETPEFSILLDHTIGVIWKVLNKDADIECLDQFHLIWALKFLEGIKPNRGHVTKDVHLLKLLIRKLIIEEYAGNDTEKPKPLDETITNSFEESINVETKLDEDKMLDQSMEEEKTETHLLETLTELNTTGNETDDLNKGFVGKNDETLDNSSNLYSFSEDPWFENRKFSAMQDESSTSKVQESKGLIGMFFSLFFK